LASPSTPPRYTKPNAPEAAAIRGALVDFHIVVEGLSADEKLAAASTTAQVIA